MKKNKKYNYGKFYNMANKSRRMVAGLIGGLLALVMIVGVIASAFS